ncbi:hypothetical protein Q3G72_014709 [Acer saccharum]|nr:hypothetical protein Q3G72_014709 [Acer saccharum]
MCGQVSDAILDACLEQDPESKVACETTRCTKTNMFMVFGEITIKAKLNYEKIVHDTCREIRFVGLDVDNCKFMPLTHVLVTKLEARLTEVRKNKTCPWLRHHGKTQHNQTVTDEQIAQDLNEQKDNHRHLSVNEGHSDKMCDQVSDAILDACLEQDLKSKVACETTHCTKTNMFMVFGEIAIKAKVNYENIVHNTYKEIGFVGLDADNCKFLVYIEEQSSDISQGVHGYLSKRSEEMGAGDQSHMFGYTTEETRVYASNSCSCHQTWGHAY